eukprot:935547-Ditylum_brightwellii.AAC.1
MEESNVCVGVECAIGTDLDEMRSPDCCGPARLLLMGYWTEGIVAGPHGGVGVVQFVVPVAELGKDRQGASLPVLEDGGNVGMMKEEMADRSGEKRPRPFRLLGSVASTYA